MSYAAEALREFHRVFDVATDNPVRGDERGREWITAELAERRMTLHREEHRELMEALGRFAHDSRGPGSYEALAQELADVLVIAYGTAHLFGINLDVAFRKVMEANMAKLPECGVCRGSGRNPVDVPCGFCKGTGKAEPLKRSDGKVMKPPHWAPPDMTEAVS